MSFETLLRVFGEDVKQQIEFICYYPKLPSKPAPRKLPSGKEDIDVNFDNQKAFPMGNDYEAKQQKLKEEWKLSYRSQMEKVGHATVCICLVSLLLHETVNN